jgi:hypothetical protein
MPADEQLANYQAQYHATLALYQKEFNHDPPADIWLAPKFREDKRRRPRPTESSSEASVHGDAPLYTFFEADAGAGTDAFDGGQSGGSGGGADWSDSAGADASSGDGGGPSCGGSSCSSGCGGGGGGD